MHAKNLHAVPPPPSIDSFTEPGAPGRPLSSAVGLTRVGESRVVGDLGVQGSLWMAVASALSGFSVLPTTSPYWRLFRDRRHKNKSFSMELQYYYQERVLNKSLVHFSECPLINIWFHALLSLPTMPWVLALLIFCLCGSQLNNPPKMQRWKNLFPHENIGVKKSQGKVVILWFKTSPGFNFNSFIVTRSQEYGATLAPSSQSALVISQHHPQL